MAQVKNLPSTGFFVGLIKSIAEVGEAIHVKLDIEGHSYFKNFWTTNTGNSHSKFLRDMGYSFEQNNRLIGKYVVCSRKEYKGKAYLNISSISDTEYEAYYIVNRMEEFDKFKNRIETQIREILSEVLLPKELNLNKVGNSLYACEKLLKELKDREQRGLYNPEDYELFLEEQS